MSLVKKLKISNTDYTIRDKNTFRSLTSAQTTQLLSNGTYEGDFVSDGEIFTSDNGKFKEYNTLPGTYAGELVSCNITPNSQDPQQEVVWGKLGDTVYYIDVSNDPTGAASYEVQDTYSQGLYYSHLGGFFLGDGETELGYMYYDEDYHVIQIDQMDGDFGYINGSPIQYPGVIGKTCGKYFIGEKNSDSIDSYYVAYHYIDEIPINNNATDLHSVTTFPAGVTKPMFFVLLNRVVMIDIATGSVYHLTTLGGSWTYDGTSNILNSYSSNCFDSPHVVNNILLVRWQGTWYRSTDYGLSFTQFTSGIDNERANILYDKDTRTYVAIIYGEPDYYWTSFDCDNWVKQTSMNGCKVGFNSTQNGLVVADSRIYSFYDTDSSYIDVKTSGEQRSLTDLSLNKSEVNTLVGGVLPSQTGQSGKFLTTDGTDASWAEVSGGSDNVYNSLTAAQRATLLSDGTYEGEAVASDTNFTQYDGTFQKFTKEQVVSDTAFVSTGHTMPTSSSYYVTKNSNGLYMAVPIDMADYCYTSTDGENWTATLGVAAIPTAIHSGALYKNGVWVICNSNASSMAYSEDDGDTWETAYSATFFPDKSFVLAGGYFIICDGYNEPCYSADGKTWTQMSSGISEIYGITYDGTQWVAATYGHKIYTNSDITNDAGWTEVTPTTAPVSNSFYSVAYSNGTYYVYGVAYLNGAWVEIVETSTDLLNWTHADKTFPDNNGWQGGYSRFICNNAFVGLEINASLWYTTNGGADWSDEISSNGHSTLVGGDLWDVTSGAISTFDATTELGNVIRSISYNKAEVDSLLSGKQKTIGGGSNISVDQSGATAYVSFYPSTTTEPPTSATWANAGTVMTDISNKNSYIDVGYDADYQPVWKQIVLANLNGNIPVQMTRNYKNIGGVTINDGIASGFAQTTKYLELPEAFNPSTSDWEMMFKFTTPNSLNPSLDAEGIFSISTFFCLVFGFHTKLCIYASSTGNDWSVTSGVDNGTTTLTTNTEYYLKVTYESGVLTAYLSTDKETWTTEYTETIALAYTDSYKPILGLYRGLGSPNKGNIDLNESYIKIGGNVWWSGYTLKLIG